MKIIWDEVGTRHYETGVQNGVLYVRNSDGTYPLGVAWNGLTTVTESPSGAESNPQYADNIKYLNLLSAEEFAATVEAFTYPDEFAQCDGTAALQTGVMIGQQDRKAFGLAYKTILGNDVDLNSHGYKLHLIYGALAAPSEKAYTTINDSPEAITFSWEVSTTPVAVTGAKPTATLIIDSTKVDADKLATLEDILFGTDVADPRLPLPDEVNSIFAGAAPAALTLDSSNPTNNATAVAVGASVVLTFNNKIAKESIIVTSAAGALVANSMTWDTAGKVLTIKPTANLAAATTYLVTIGGVVDIYGQALADTVNKFTTA